MKDEFQDQGQLDQDLEEWLSPRGSQPVHNLFSKEGESRVYTDGVSGFRGSNDKQQSSRGRSILMVVIKWSDKVEGYGDNIDSPL